MKFKTTTCPKCLGKGTITDRTSIHEQMTRRRSLAGFTRLALSQAMGISLSYLKDLEAGKRPWSDELIERHEEALKATHN